MLPDVVVLEVFARGNIIDKHMILTMERVGGVKSLCKVFNIPCFAVSPQMKTAFMQPATAMIKARKEGITEHEKDSLAHLLSFEYRVQKGITKIAPMGLTSLEGLTIMSIDPGGSTGVAFKIGREYLTNTLTDPEGDDLWSYFQDGLKGVTLSSR